MAEDQKTTKGPAWITDEQMKTAIAWFQEQIGLEKECPMCSNVDWKVGPLFVELPTIAFHTEIYPNVLLVCERCGHTLLFNALVMGLRPPADEEGDDV